MSTQASTENPGTEATVPRVVVGVEGAEQSTGPVLWASSEAARHRLPLQLVTACAPLLGPVPGRPGAYVAASVEKTAVEALARLGEEFRGDVNLLPAHVATGPARRVLLDALDHGARMLVVGRRGLNATERVLVGSTSIAVAGRSPVTVVVVPETWEPAQHTSAPVIVGVTLGEDDDPHENDDLLRFAFDHARELGVALVVIHSWEVPSLQSWSPDDVEAHRARVAARLDNLLASWRTEYPDVVVDPRTPAESLTDAVLDASRVGQLAVLGRHTPASRHLGLRLGSTARGVLHRAETPVAVVPLAIPAHGDTATSPASSDVWGPTF